MQPTAISRWIFWAALLAFGHAPGTHHKALDAAVLAVVAFFQGWGVE